MVDAPCAGPHESRAWKPGHDISLTKTVAGKPGHDISLTKAVAGKPGHGISLTNAPSGERRCKAKNFAEEAELGFIGFDDRRSSHKAMPFTLKG